ncbi:MAG: prepilin-type N-terminal cleavage/methylation domain-containing protein [Gammaproteobacteria bacterium]|jgi:prepilin-type N-terminal cleavage/methylation domain-containing protein|nr:prepilin-type N-terminal cleavage/methylation domain-containing protein [Gammaproteobacteria bacterium]MDH3749594.1 prepilin-type N-terminal cleavage/methylation domain-containing protein [Gammaproteobacteria bacterium]MDH3804058.1 prepilin-type N-terminal cleavage/methylation domain-containing protein [Gammaproteobacteria bacterium]
MMVRAGTSSGLNARKNASRTASPGFSLLELIVVIVIISILVAVALDRLLPYIDEAERIGVLTFESQIKSTLMVAAAKRIAGGKAASISELDGSNPMHLMLETPDNYVGELRGYDKNSVPRRNWYFDLNTRRLVYRIGRRFSWSDDNESMNNPEFEVRVAFDDRNGNGRFEPGTDELYGIRLQREAGSVWLVGRDSAG